MSQQCLCSPDKTLPVSEQAWIIHVWSRDIHQPYESWDPCLVPAEASLTCRCPKEVSLCLKDNEFKFSLFFTQTDGKQWDQTCSDLMAWQPFWAWDPILTVLRTAVRAENLWVVGLNIFKPLWLLTIEPKKFVKWQRYGSRICWGPGYCRLETLAVHSWLLSWRSIWALCCT